MAEGFAQYQPLSDWRLEIDVDQNCLQFRLSAALRMIKPSELRGAGNYWGTPEPAVRIDIVFTVDAVTRTALFTVPLTATAESTAPRSLLTPPLANGVRLDDATIDSRGRLYALTAGVAVQLVELSSTDIATLVLEHYSVGRLPNGVLASPPYPVYPRIWLDAVDLATMMRLCDGASSMDLKDGSFGHLQQDRESDVPTQSIEKASFRVRVDESGLTVTYHLFVTNLWHQGGESSYRPDWLDGAFALPWPTIVLRFPRRHLLSWRRRIERRRA